LARSCATSPVYWSVLPRVHVALRGSLRSLHPLFVTGNSMPPHLYTLSLHDALPICFLTASKQFRHGATSKSRSNTASNSTKHKSPHLSGWRQIISLIT